MRLIESKYTNDQNNLRIRIEHDETPMHPRTDMDGHLGVMVCWHGRYNLGDEQPSCDQQEYRLSLAEEYSPDLGEKIEKQNELRYERMRPLNSDSEWRDYSQQCVEYTNERIDAILDKHYIMLPLYLYDHSGITMSTSSFSCQWDSGQVGFIYAKKSDIRKEYDWKQISPKRYKQVCERLKGEVELYDTYLRGEVYGFIAEKLMPCPTDWEIEEWAEVDEHWEETDSCWGFFGMDIVENGILDHLDDEYRQVFCEAEGITLEQLKVEEDEWVQKVMAA